MERRKLLRLMAGTAAVALMPGLTGCVVETTSYRPVPAPRPVYRPPQYYNYYYYPNVAVYYHVHTGFYWYFTDGYWRRSRRLPGHIRLRGPRHMFEIRNENPYERHRDHRRRYGNPGRGHGPDGNWRYDRNDRNRGRDDDQGNGRDRRRGGDDDRVNGRDRRRGGDDDQNNGQGRDGNRNQYNSRGGRSDDNQDNGQNRDGNRNQYNSRGGRSDDNQDNGQNRDGNRNQYNSRGGRSDDNQDNGQNRDRRQNQGRDQILNPDRNRQQPQPRIDERLPRKPEKDDSENGGDQSGEQDNGNRKKKPGEEVVPWIKKPKPDDQ